MCRTCYFDIPLFEESLGEEGSGDDVVDIPDYPECPCCVMVEYGRSAAEDEDGARCKPYAPLLCRGFFVCCRC